MTPSTMTFAHEPEASWRLPARQLLTLAPAAEARYLAVSRGLLWATRSASRLDEPVPQDVWLAAGDGTWLAPGTGWLIEAEADAAFALRQAPRPASVSSAWRVAWQALRLALRSPTAHRVPAMGSARRGSPSSAC